MTQLNEQQLNQVSGGVLVGDLGYNLGNAIGTAIKGFETASYKFGIAVYKFFH